MVFGGFDEQLVPMDISVVDEPLDLGGLLRQIGEDDDSLIKRPQQLRRADASAVSGEEENVLELHEARSGKHPKDVFVLAVGFLFRRRNQLQARIVRALNSLDHGSIPFSEILRLLPMVDGKIHAKPHYTQVKPSAPCVSTLARSSPW